MDALKFLDSCETYDLILADPPYRYPDTTMVIETGINRLNEGMFLILESSPREYPISPARVKLYGDTQLTFWKKEK